MILVLGTALVVGACGFESPARCGAAPDRPIVGFVVTTVTADNPTNAFIDFCITRKSTGSEECGSLDNWLKDDFKSHATDTFRLNPKPPIAPGDLERFVVRNNGGDFLSSSWEMAALSVSAVLEGGGTVPLYEVDFSGDGYMDEGDTYDSSQCAY